MNLNLSWLSYFKIALKKVLQFIRKYTTDSAGTQLFQDKAQQGRQVSFFKAWSI